MYPRRDQTQETHLTVRLIGPHGVAGHMTNGRLQVMIPGAAITIADKHALIGVYRALVEAGVIARQVFTGDRRTLRLYNRVPQRISASVLIMGRQPGPTVYGKAPEISPSGCGQLVIRLVHLTIVCDDLAAWDSQNTGWRAACQTAATEWRGPRLSQVEAAAERNALARLRARIAD